MRFAAVVMMLSLALVGWTEPVRAQANPSASAPQAASANQAPSTPQTDFSSQAYPEAFKALFLLFVMAVILESALAILFNWRPFVETFNARAVRPIVSLIVSGLLVAHFNLDIVSSLARLIQPGVPSFDATGQILTAMVIAGGSAGVNNLMVGLGFRQARTPETVTPKPPQTEGWISVSIVRKLAVGPVTISIGPTVNGKTPIAGVVDKSTRTGFLSYFLRDPGRFPGYGGYRVVAGNDISVEATANDAQGNPLPPKTWGPNVIAGGAIIDLKFEI